MCDEEGIDKGLLREKHIDVVVWMPCALHFETKEVLGIGIKVHPHVKVMFEAVFENSFNFRASRKVQKVIYIKAHIKWRETGDDSSREQTRGVGAGDEA